MDIFSKFYPTRNRKLSKILTGQQRITEFL